MLQDFKTPKQPTTKCAQYIALRFHRMQKFKHICSPDASCCSFDSFLSSFKYFCPLLFFFYCISLSLQEVLYQRGLLSALSLAQLGLIWPWDSCLGEGPRCPERAVVLWSSFGLRLMSLSLWKGDLLVAECQDSVSL